MNENLPTSLRFDEDAIFSVFGVHRPKERLLNELDNSEPGVYRIPQGVSDDICGVVIDSHGEYHLLLGWDDVDLSRLLNSVEEMRRVYEGQRLAIEETFRTKPTQPTPLINALKLWRTNKDRFVKYVSHELGVDLNPFIFMPAHRVRARVDREHIRGLRIPIACMTLGGYASRWIYVDLNMFESNVWTKTPVAFMNGIPTREMIDSINSNVADGIQVIHEVGYGINAFITRCEKMVGRQRLRSNNPQFRMLRKSSF